MIVPAHNAGQALALVVVDELARHGIRDAVLSPGSRSTPLALALAGDERIRLHVRIDERSTAFTALGLARVSGLPVPVLCTSGTAAAEFTPAVLEADQGRVPLLVLTADRPPELRGVGANQTIDQIKLYGDAVRWFHELGVPEARPDAVRYWRSTISQAVATATGASGAPGPVHVNLPLREPLVPVDDGIGFPFPLDGRDVQRPWSEHKRVAPTLPTDVHDLLVAAQRGVIVAGDGLTAEDAIATSEFAAAAGWPLLAEPHSNARRGGAALAGYDAVLRDAVFRDDHVPDVVLVVGRVGLTRALNEWLSWLPATTAVVVLDRFGGWWDGTRTARLIVSAAAASLRGVGAAASAAEGWVDGWLHAATSAANAVDEVLDSVGLCEPRVVRDLVAAVPDETLIAIASSMPIRDVDLTMRPRTGVRIVANRGVSGIDGFISTAVGAALAHDRPSWAIAGDLSALHDVNGLLADPCPDLSIVVINNDGGGIFSLLAQADSVDPRSFERVFGTPHGVSFADICRGYGVDHVFVDELAAYQEVIATTPKRLRVIEVRTDRAANADLHRRLAVAAASAVNARGHPATDA
ncbi:MAG TPA: 2-succinyl-5-enolpyruvyl-6-hydroxy-3-cyclohexene-1-carboxylic-acid synthase [Mycobacteriales bacterium]|nr:2-succinyl-5-enolpyruvyl-6-hydroxy-3-cyclohexene-1-carboxylic-acid synthase [Mycobacteriales bacterium]